MRTVDDLRAALVSLEAAAPSTDDLLSRAPRPAGPGGHRRWVLPATCAALVIAGIVAVAALLTLSPDRTGPAAHGTVSGAVRGPAHLLPFRLTGSLPEVTGAYVQSVTDPSDPSGNAVLTEYGMEVTIDVATSDSGAPTSGSPVSVHGEPGLIDTSCPVRDAATTPGETVNPTCFLSFASGPWQVAIYVAGPGGGSRAITQHQFLELGDQLQLASTPSDVSTWFTAKALLPS